MSTLLNIRLLAQRARLLKAPFDLNTLEVIAAHSEASPWDYPFNQADAVSIAASTNDQTVVSFRIPSGMAGVLDGFANGVENMADWDQITWRVLVGGQPIPGFDNIQGAMGSVNFPVKVGWPIFGDSQLVSVIASNTGATALTNVCAVLTGRYFANTIEALLGT